MSVTVGQYRSTVAFNTTSKLPDSISTHAHLMSCWQISGQIKAKFIAERGNPSQLRNLVTHSLYIYIGGGYDTVFSLEKFRFFRFWSKIDFFFNFGSKINFRCKKSIFLRKNSIFFDFWSKNRFLFDFGVKNRFRCIKKNKKREKMVPDSKKNVSKWCATSIKNNKKVFFIFFALFRLFLKNFFYHYNSVGGSHGAAQRPREAPS